MCSKDICRSKSSDHEHHLLLPSVLVCGQNVDRMRFLLQEGYSNNSENPHILSFLSGGAFRMTLNIISNLKARVDARQGEARVATSNCWDDSAGSSHRHHLSFPLLSPSQWQQFFFGAWCHMLFFLCGFPPNHCSFFILLQPSLFP